MGRYIIAIPALKKRKKRNAPSFPALTCNYKDNNVFTSAGVFICAFLIYNSLWSLRRDAGFGFRLFIRMKFESFWLWQFWNVKAFAFIITHRFRLVFCKFFSVYFNIRIDWLNGAISNVKWFLKAKKRCVPTIERYNKTIINLWRGGRVNYFD